MEPERIPTEIAQDEDDDDDEVIFDLIIPVFICFLSCNIADSTVHRHVTFTVQSLEL
jgi:hypothetical protein